MTVRRHAFTDDALGEHDAVALADLVRRGEVSPQELARATQTRADKVEDLNAVAFAPPTPRYGVGGRFYGVPTYVKDNTDVRGMPTNQGSEAYVARPARKDGRYAIQFLSTGLTVMGKSRMPEFGFNATTEFRTEEPTRNPWNPQYSVGASSGGAAALVASGVVPIAHGNDGGGSIRIPAAAAGLVGLKPTRSRHVEAEISRTLPLNTIGEGVLSRSVRDTAVFTAALEEAWRNPKLPPVGLVEGPSGRRMRIGLVTNAVNGAPIDDQTADVVRDVAEVLGKLGHDVVPIGDPVAEQFGGDFVLYWSLLATLAATFGRFSFGVPVDQGRLDGLTRGLRRHQLRHAYQTPFAIRRLRATAARYAAWINGYDAILSPVLAHVTPKIGHLSPRVPFDELLYRLTQYVTFTPLHNIAGAPGISLPVGLSREGLPMGVHLAAAYGGERTLLELAYAVEAERPMPRIYE
jgi:amidase